MSFYRYMAFIYGFMTLIVTVGLDLLPLSFYFPPPLTFCNSYDCHDYLKRIFFSVTSEVHGKNETDSFSGWVNFTPKKRKNSEKFDQVFYRHSPASTLKKKSIENYNQVAFKQAHLWKKLWNQTYPL